MEETARRHEASLELEHGPNSSFLSLNITLQERIRSLLLSRNDKRPPKTPCPTPDDAYLHRYPNEVPIGNSLAPPRSHSFNSTGTISRLETLRSLSLEMGATRFDGPAGQFDEEETAKGRRHSTNTKMQSDRISLLEEIRVSAGSGVNRNTRGDLVGRKLSPSSGLDRSKSVGAKRPINNHSPQLSFTLRTVPPKTPKAPEQRLRPNAFQVPRDHQSNAEPRIISSLVDDAPEDVHHVHTPSESASDALHKIQGHDSRPLAAVQPLLHATSSQATLKSTASAHHPITLSESGADSHSITSPALEPILATGVSGEEPSEQTLESSTTEKGFEEANTYESRLGLVEPQLVGSLDANSPLKEHPPSMLNLHSVTLRADEASETPESTLIPKLPTENGSSAKLSPISRALSMLSEFSAKSGLRTPRRGSTTKENRLATDIANEPQTTDSSIPPTEGQEYHWYRQIIGKRSSTSIGTSHLTARPSKRKEVATVVPRKNLFNRQSTDDGSMIRGQQKASESFQKVIVDLESLLKEALDIAGRASREHSDIESAPRTLKNGYNRLSTGSCDSKSSIEVTTDQENRQGHVVIVEPENEDFYHGHFNRARNATPFPRSLAATRHQSTVPPLETEDADLEHQTPSNEIPFIPQSMNYLEPFRSTDWAFAERPSLRPPQSPTMPPSSQAPIKEQHNHLVRDHGLTSEISGYNVNSHPRPPIQPRSSSMKIRSRLSQKRSLKIPPEIVSSEESISTSGPYVADFRNSALQYHPVYREITADEPSNATQPRINSVPNVGRREDFISTSREPKPQGQAQGHSHPTRDEIRNGYSLKGHHHFEIREPHGFSLSRSHRRAPIARDWSTPRKRFVAAMTCVNTVLLGLIIGIYSGEVPAIQYAVADDHHIVILGNVVFFIGLAITTALFWPLPLLHGRKPYTMAALTILLPLLFPQALSINGSRNPYVATYRVGLLVPRAIAGLVMGFANINFKTTLLDLFGASLQSSNPHQEMVNGHDVRRHGGGMGVWLSIWTWCSIGSIGIGFWIGASIISGLQVSWGFWILIILTASVLLLNVITPEVRRSAYRRSMTEVRSGSEISRRIARGEIKMHLDSTGPIWWWEEVWAGHVLCIRMLKQPGFAVLAVYLGWIYGQVVLVIVLLGALLSKYYYFHPQFVGLSVAIIPLGALFAIPFQKASLFSRSRHHKQRTDSMTFEKRVTWTSHLVRRAIFMIMLPFAGLAYTLASHGPPTHFMVPVIFAGVIGFLSSLAIAECNGIIMETFDTSDLQPGMTGRPRHVLPEELKKKRTNFSCFPRVTAGFAVAHTIAFSIGAAVTGWGGVVERHVGAQTASAVMAGVLLLWTLLLVAVLTRYKTVQIIPSERFGTNILSGPEDEWKPIIIGNPSGTTRRVSLLELGRLSRWTEIRRRNRLGTGF